MVRTIKECNAIDIQERVSIIQKILDEKKAVNVEVIDVQESLLADYFIVASGTSNTHIRAIADGLLLEGRDAGLTKLAVEGYKEAKWVLVDYGDIVVHLFAEEERGFYDVETLWKQMQSIREHQKDTQ